MNGVFEKPDEWNSVYFIDHYLDGLAIGQMGKYPGWYYDIDLWDITILICVYII